MELGAPSKSTFMGAAKGYAYGAVAGIANQFIGGLFGNSLLGNLGTAIGTAALIKGEEGKMLAMMLGFNAVMSGSLGLGTLGIGNSAASNDEGSV